jgi:hypothetical protein
LFSKSQLAELDEVMSKIDIGTKVVFNKLSVSMRQHGFKLNQVYCVTEIEECKSIYSNDPVCSRCVGHIGLNEKSTTCLMPADKHLPFFDLIDDSDFITEKDMEI